MTADKPKRIAYIDMATGIAGDMFVGAMIDAGFPLERLREGLAGVGLKGVRIDACRVTRRGLGGTKFEVTEEGQGDMDRESPPSTPVTPSLPPHVGEGGGIQGFAPMPGEGWGLPVPGPTSGGEG
jgi:hypothetical protein